MEEFKEYEVHVSALVRMFAEDEQQAKERVKNHIELWCRTNRVDVIRAKLIEKGDK